VGSGAAVESLILVAILAYALGLATASFAAAVWLMGYKRQLELGAERVIERADGTHWGFVQLD
jgi:hypothetical protein